MTTHLWNPFRVALGLLFVVAVPPCWGQAVPADFEILGTAGGLVPGATYASLHIAADGQGEYHRFRSEELSDALETTAFTLESTEVELVWQAIQSNGFFGLDAEYMAADIRDRTFARLVVTADGVTHVVATRNIAVAGFDNVVSTLNSLTPGDRDLVYDTSLPVTLTATDICDQPGKQGQGSLRKHTLKRDEGGGRLTGSAPPLRKRDTEAHPGSAVGYRMTLQEAVGLGIASLSGKGEFYGDAVSISIDNSSSATSNRLSISLYLEMWGPGASAANSQIVENAIESAWSGSTTTGGTPVTMDVTTRTRPGGSTPPGTPGYHQIKMVDEDIESDAGLATVNGGVESGTWQTGSDNAELYAHEAGHLLGLEDRYDEYYKQTDGTWKREGDGEEFTSEELADEIGPRFPTKTPAEIQEGIEKPGRTRITAPQPGAETDIMGSLNGGVVQSSDIDAIASNAGLIIEIRPGDILLNKDGSQQNFVITRSEDVFVPAGESKTLEGLWAACIDYEKGIPTSGTGFDLAPSLALWSGIEAAPLLQTLVDYVSEADDFCPSNFVAQEAIWRLTDNDDVGDDDVIAYLQVVGIDVGERLLDFPRMSNPNAPNPGTTSLTPGELYVPSVATPAGNVLSAGATATMQASVSAPSLEGVSSVFSWTLSPPAGSAATLTSNQGESSSFVADLRGIYHVELEVVATDNMSNAFTNHVVSPFVAADAQTETFEIGALRSGGPFYWETSGGNPWRVTDDVSHTGAFSVVTASIGASGTTVLEVTFQQVAAGSLSFAYKVSSEEGFDVLLFFLDGVEHGRWSGKTDWGVSTTNLGPGEHTASWVYTKDSSVSEGADLAWIDDVLFPQSATFTAIEDVTEGILPTTYQLSQSYPNPFNPTTTIGFSIPQPEHVTLVVYDALGRRIATLVDGLQNPGRYEVQFDGHGLSNGIYYYEMRAGPFHRRKAMVLLR